ncbi:hypothetical protein LSTR_LSTR012475 [Laodelphax striatellus]|uniref:(+)RNA virus helicase C-terminal domain-containing protein n=1 Tax=Laodelphax striatellus TaxID=195883 RepID=A0A482WPP7_LAOST|nr:hypothetical protein LSTR_LSTR012475 [Laodelphax striatellus]
MKKLRINKKINETFTSYESRNVNLASIETFTSYESRNVNLASILNQINVFNTNVKTPKSRLNLVYNFGEYVDVMICFVKLSESKFKTSKGFSALTKKRHFSQEEWKHLDRLENTNIKLSLNHGNNNNNALFLVNCNEEAELNFCFILKTLNDWSNKNYPLIVGVDAFNDFFEMPATDLLSVVLEVDSLRFVFAYRGYCDIKFLNIPNPATCADRLPETPLGVFPGNSKLEIYLNAMIELRYIVSSTDIENSKIYKQVLSSITQSNIAGSNGEILNVLKKAKLSKAQEIIVVGDSQQLPYIERSSLETKWHKISGFCEPYAYLSTTRRCPVDVCYAISSHYHIIATLNNRITSILPTYRLGEQHFIFSETLFLTFTQEEKQRVAEALNWGKNSWKGWKLHTIHEAQGLTSKNVVLIRIDYNNKEIYNSMQHAIVALSRHTNTFRYLTTSIEKDAVDKLIDKIKTTNETELQKWNKERICKLKNELNHG